jgi:hypothetical protein
MADSSVADYCSENSYLQEMLNNCPCSSTQRVSPRTKNCLTVPEIPGVLWMNRTLLFPSLQLHYVTNCRSIHSAFKIAS